MADVSPRVNLKIITRLKIEPTFLARTAHSGFNLKLQIERSQGVEAHKNLRHTRYHSVALNDGKIVLRAQAALWLDWFLF